MPKKSVQLSGVSVAATSISSIDPERGVLMYRGYDIADLAEHIAQLPTIVAHYDRRRRGLDAVPPDPSLSYAENFLTMLRGEAPTEQEARAFDVLMILHAEHEMNASTFTARVVAGTLADLHSAVVAAICALKGSLHGGANERAIEFVEEVGDPAAAAEAVRARFERKQTIFGFGHPVYVTMDPRAVILKRWSQIGAEYVGPGPRPYPVASRSSSGS